MRLLLALPVVWLCGCKPDRPVTAHGKPVRHWVQALQDPDVQVRVRAARVLGNVGVSDPAVVPALTRAVKDSAAEVRVEAILALLKLGPDAREALPALTEAEQDEDERVRSCATRARTRIRGGQ